MKNPLDKLKRKPVHEETVRPHENDSRTSIRRRYTQEDLEKMTEDQVAALPPEILERFTPEKLSKLPIDALKRLNKETLGRVDSKILAELGKKDYSRLLKLSPDKFFDVLKADASLLDLYTTDDLVGMFGTQNVLRYLIRLPHEDLIKRLHQPLLTHLMKQPGEEYQRLNALFNKPRPEQPARTFHEPPPSIPLSVESNSFHMGPYWDPVSPSAALSSPVSRVDDGGSRQQGTLSRHHPPLSYANRLPQIPRRSRSASRSNGNPTLYHDDPRSPDYHASFSERSRTAMESPDDRARELRNKGYFESKSDYSSGKEFTSSSTRFLDDMNGDRREISKLKDTIEQLEKRIDELQSSNREKDRHREGEHRSLTDQIADLKTELRVIQRTTEKRVSDFLRKKGVNVSMSPNDDPIDMLIGYTDQFYDQASYNYRIAMDTKTQISDAETGKTALEQQLAQARDEISTLRATEERLRTRASEATYLGEQNKLMSRKLSELVAKYNAELDRDTAELRGQNLKLQQDLAELRNTYGVKFEEKRKWYEEEARIAKQEAEKIRNEFLAQLREKEDECVARIQAEKDHFDGQLAKEKANFEMWLRERDDLHTQNVTELKNTVTSLRGSLVDNSDDFRPATDDALKEKYLSLKLAIQTVTFYTGNNGVQRSGSGFSGRQGDWQRFRLQSIVWAKVIEGFFSQPFGFGALGPGDGRNKLVTLYHAWKDIFDVEPNADAGYYPPDEFDIFRTSLNANKWRSATFQSMFAVIFPKGQKKGQPPSGAMVHLFSSNMDRIRDEIVDILEQSSADGVPEELNGDISRIVKLAGELALEFGCQRALLGVEAPESGDTVKIGQGFVDCQNGDANRGQTEEVDLVVSPKLYRIGDGRNDLKMVKVICSGDIYPKV